MPSAVPNSASARVGSLTARYASLKQQEELKTQVYAAEREAEAADERRKAEVAARKAAAVREARGGRPKADKMESKEGQTGATGTTQMESDSQSSVAQPPKIELENFMPDLIPKTQQERITERKRRIERKKRFIAKVLIHSFNFRFTFKIIWKINYHLPI